MAGSQLADSTRHRPRRARAAAQTDPYADLHRGFAWQVPARFNIAEVCCARWARAPRAAERVAILEHPAAPDGAVASHSYAQLHAQACRLSQVLRGLGVQRGDRVAIVLPQRFETAVAYMAVLQMGAVAMPLSILFGPDALEYRLQDSAAVVALCDDTAIDTLAALRPRCPALRSVIGLGAAAGRADVDYSAALARASARFVAARTRADEAAVLVYTSGTTGPPKGALIAHRGLIGNLSGFVCSQNWFGFDPFPLQPMAPRPARAGGRGAHKAGMAPSAADTNTSVFWSPADWAWTGGLFDALLPTLYFGRPIVACSSRFSPELAFGLLQRHGVTHSFLFPTALKAMMKAYPQPRRHFRLALQGLMSAGEAVGDAVFGWCQQQLGLTVNEMFGQTEVNYIVGNCARLWPARAGSMGRAYPGHRVAVIDEQGQPCAVGVVGDVAVHRQDVHGRPDPVFFLGYWRNPAATAAKFSGDWCRTGDLAHADADGYLWYQGRSDDMFKAAGYRIGPGEIENCLLKHPAVANAAVVPKPDAQRGALVKAYVVLAPDYLAQRAQAGPARAAWEAALTEQLQRHVRGTLAPYEYPKEVEFIDALPMTTTGKVQRRVLRLQEEERARKLQPPPTRHPLPPPP